jgi:hypothetical protein
MYSKLFSNLFKFTSTKQLQTHKYTYAKDIPHTVQRNHMNLFTAVNSAIDITLETDSTYFFIF